MKRLALSIAILSSVVGLRSASATLVDTNFTESIFVNNAPGALTGMAWAPDGSQRLFLTVKTGEVRVVENGVLLPTPFATISPVRTDGECGLIGLAFDPNFAGNGYVYFFVTVSASEQQILRYTASGNTGSAKTTIVRNLPTSGAGHNGGAVGFGPDGKLYWAIGDNGNATGVNEDLASLAAKLGRANPDGSVPSDNPFYDGAGPNADAIWARGFRNPFTFNFQPSTGLLWLNTVGTAYEQVFIARRGDHAGYSKYENDQPASGFISPVISYRTNGADSWPIAGSGASRSSGIATFTVTAAHGFRLGGKIAIAGVGDASFNGSGYVTAIASATQFSIAQPGPNATSGGGTATMLDIGGCITGGAFLESTAVPAAYRGNYFFGDHNSGNIERVTLNGNNVATSVDTFATNLIRQIDIDVGPDGNLYYAYFGGVVRRAVYKATAQALIVSRRFVRTNEGGSAAFHVRLAIAPSGPVDVAVSRASGDADISVAQGAALTFTAANWSTPQPVRIATAPDTDVTEDVATIAVASTGLTTENVTMHVTDGVASGGTGGTGGSGGTAGSSGTAGTAGSSETGGTGGSTGGAGGSTGAPDASATGGSGANASGAGGTSSGGGGNGVSGTGGASSATPPSPIGTDEDESCGCRIVGTGGSAAGLAWLGLLALAARRRRR